MVDFVNTYLLFFILSAYRNEHATAVMDKLGLVYQIYSLVIVDTIKTIFPFFSLSWWKSIFCGGEETTKSKYAYKVQDDLNSELLD